jgi:phytoene desaturase
LIHHNLFFNTDFEKHADAIYKKPEWVKEPLFYVCMPSKTDDTVAPDSYENLFILIPHSTELESDQELIERNFENVLSRLELYCGEVIREHIVYRRDFSGKDFKSEYNSFKGNAYGLANTLMQTAFFKPKMKNKKLGNLLYTGQLTVPGPGVPPALISGKIAAIEMDKILTRIEI